MSDEERRSNLARQMRETAEEKLARSKDSAELTTEKAVEELLHELRVHQAELETQNEELRRTQLELDATRARYFDLYDLAPVGYCTLSEQGLILEANLAAATLLGVARGALVKQLITRFIHKENQDIYYLHHKQLFQSGEPQACELRMVKQDETAFWAYLAATAALDADGAPVSHVILYDTTERKQAEETLLREQTMLARTEGIANIGSWEWDIATDTVIWSDELFRIFQRDPREGAPSFAEHPAFYHPEGMARLQQVVEAAVTEGTPYELELQAIRKDGETRACVARGVAEMAPGGRAVHLFGSLQDITDRKRVEEALRESEALLKEVGEMARVGGWQLDVETKQVFWTSETYRIHEIPEGERSDLSQALLFYDLPGRSALETALQRCMETGEEFDLELPFTSAKGKHLWTRAMGRAVRADGKVIWLKGTFQDISERKRAEELSAKARADFLFAVSHELKTPLFLMASAQELLESLPQEQRAGRFLEYGEIWNRNLHRLRHLIENLVDSQRTEGMGLKITLVPTDIKEILQQTLKDVELLAHRQRISFRLLGDELPQIPADPESIHRLFENLLTNAIKFSPSAGEVEISLTQQGEEAVFRVRDFGAGIAPEEIPLLFQPFQRTAGANRAVIPGTGLGLYTAKLIAEAHGGSIALTSELGKGTTIVVRVPIYPHPLIGAGDA